MRAEHRVLAVALGALLTARGGVGHGEPAPNQRSQGSAPARYRIDATKSRFIVETETSSLALMFAHDHRIEARQFSGVAKFSPAGRGAASVELTVRADSLQLIEEKTIADRAAIENALREDVLETAKYPEISFKSRAVTFERR
jgi:polyisoprenoid-binding protein YceI